MMGKRHPQLSKQPSPVPEGPLLNCEVTLNKLQALLALWNLGVTVLAISQARGPSPFFPQTDGQPGT